jgi:hypothetical protein
LVAAVVDTSLAEHNRVGVDKQPAVAVDIRAVVVDIQEQAWAGTEAGAVCMAAVAAEDSSAEMVIDNLLVTAVDTSLFSTFFFTQYYVHY